MIIVDIETSGIDFVKNGIWQIGAIEFDNPENTFLQEARIDDEDEIMEDALKVTGKTENELRNIKKQTQKQLLENFFNWVSKIENKTMVAMNTPFDHSIIYIRSKKYKLESPLKHRTFDLHTIAALKYFQINGKFLVENGSSKMNLPKIIEFVGMEDNRLQLKDGHVVKQGKPHEALDDCKLEAECLSRILYGKNMFKEFENFKVPGYLL